MVYARVACSRRASACLERCRRLVERVDRDLRIERRKLSHLLKTCARLGEIRLCDLLVAADAAAGEDRNLRSYAYRPVRAELTG